jgi:FkbM family methyltransferase
MTEIPKSFLPARREAWSPLPAGPLLIYGAGNKGRQVAAFLLDRGYPIIGFADAAAGGTESWRGLPVRRLEDWWKDGTRRNVTIVVAIHNHVANLAQLLARLADEASGRIVNPVEFQAIFADDFPASYWLAGPQAYAGQEAALDDLARLLADDDSRDLLRRVIDCRLNGNYAALPDPTPAEQYCPSDLPQWPQALRLVDAGAFNGDTLRQFKRCGYEFEQIAAFEPDPKNFARLSHCVEKLGGGVCIPCGLSDSSRQVRFEAEGSGSSRISDEGGEFIQCVALDQALPGFHPNLIKMDIEGAEPDALGGAARTIAACRPALAISVYHHPAHLWEIPFLIRDWDLDYRFHLRMHGHSSFDLVLYALPGTVADSSRFGTGAEGAQA